MGACSSQPICYQQSGDCAPCTPCVPSVPCVPCSPIPPCAAIVPCVGTVPCVPCMPIGGVQGSLGPLQCAPTGPCYPAGQINTCPCVPMQQPTATTPCVPCVPCVAGGAPLGCMPGQVNILIWISDLKVTLLKVHHFPQYFRRNHAASEDLSSSTLAIKCLTLFLVRHLCISLSSLLVVDWTSCKPFYC